MKKSKSISGLSLNKEVISVLQADKIIGGKMVQPTMEGSCQTTSCVCTNNQHCAPQGSGQFLCA